MTKRKVASLLLVICLLFVYTTTAFADNNIIYESRDANQHTVVVATSATSREVTKTARLYKNISLDGRTVSLIVNYTLAGTYDVNSTTGRITSAGSSSIKNWSYTVNSPIEGDPWYVRCVNIKTYPGSITPDGSKVTFRVVCKFEGVYNPGGIDYLEYDLFDVNDSFVGYA